MYLEKSEVTDEKEGWNRFTLREVIRKITHEVVCYIRTDEWIVDIAIQHAQSQFDEARRQMGNKNTIVHI